MSNSAASLKASSNDNNNIKNIGDASKDQISKGMVLQNYCNSILQQPKVDFSSDPDLNSFQTDINNSLSTAQQHANEYLGNICPSMMSSLSALQNYFTLYRSVPVSLPQGSTNDQWIQLLGTVKSVSETNLRDSKTITSLLHQLELDLSKDADDFAQIVTQLNTVMKGDNGVLDSITSQLSSIDSQIAGTIVATVGGGLGILGGAFTIAVGAVADFVTAGTNPELVIGGVVMVVTGIATEAGTIVTLVSLYDQKAKLLQEQSHLNMEVNLVAGISSAYTQISSQVKEAASAASYMENAWQLLDEDLESLIDDLQSGILSADAARTMFLQEANTDINRVLEDITTIKAQMAGVTVATLPKGENVIEFLNNLPKSA